MTIPISSAVLLVPALLLLGIVIGALAMSWHLRDRVTEVRETETRINQFLRIGPDLMDDLADPEPEPEVVVPDMHDVYLPEDEPVPAPMPPALAAALTAALVLEALTWRYKRVGRHDGHRDSAGHALYLALTTKTTALPQIEVAS